MNGHPTRLKLDTGAGVSVLSDKTPWLNNCQLDRHPIKLRGLGGIPLPVIGALKVTMRYQNREIVETVYVLRNQSTSPLSKAACVSLKIISRVDEISGSATTNFGAEFPKLFTGLGKLNTDYRITLQLGPHHSVTLQQEKFPTPCFRRLRRSWILC